MDVSNFDFLLPNDLIALRPASPRSNSRLLSYIGGKIENHKFTDLVDLLTPGDLLVFNDTRVIPALLYGKIYHEDSPEIEKKNIELLLAKRLKPKVWACLTKSTKRIKFGSKISFGPNMSGQVVGRGSEGLIVTLAVSPL